MTTANANGTTELVAKRPTVGGYMLITRETGRIDTVRFGEVFFLSKGDTISWQPATLRPASADADGQREDSDE